MTEAQFTRIARSAILCFATLFAFPVAAADTLPRGLSDELSSNWIRRAKPIRTPDYMIYFRGKATGGYSPNGKSWSGEVRGRVVYLSPTKALVCSFLRIENDAPGIGGGYTFYDVPPGKAAPWKEFLK